MQITFLLTATLAACVAATFDFGFDASASKNGVNFGDSYGSVAPVHHEIHIGGDGLSSSSDMPPVGYAPAVMDKYNSQSSTKSYAPLQPYQSPQLLPNAVVAPINPMSAAYQPAAAPAYKPVAPAPSYPLLKPVVPPTYQSVVPVSIPAAAVAPQYNPAPQYVPLQQPIPQILLVKPVAFVNSAPAAAVTSVDTCTITRTVPPPPPVITLVMSVIMYQTKMQKTIIEPITVSKPAAQLPPVQPIPVQVQPALATTCNEAKSTPAAALSRTTPAFSLVSATPSSAPTPARVAGAKSAPAYVVPLPPIKQNPVAAAMANTKVAYANPAGLLTSAVIETRLISAMAVVSLFILF
ncbi:hypothetical protein BC830DRAFT_1135696 [Chytriomyces sp. MP71]|nr:hypothetical protein BC830DRAFT_1135696 [Chytriomyces sp. MP71]